MDSQNNLIETSEKNAGGILRALLRGWSGKLLVVSGLVTLFHQLYLYFHWGGDEHVDAVNDGVALVIYALVLFFVARTAGNSQLTGRVKRAWRFFALGFASYTIATALWGYFEVITQTQPFPSWADPFYLAFYVFMFIGLLLAAPENKTGEERLKLMLDAGIVTLGGAMLLWYFLLQPMAQASSGDGLMKVLSLAYPVCDLVLVFAISVVLFRQRAASVRRSMDLLMGAIFIFFVADVLFSYQNLNGTYRTGTLADSLYTVAAFLSVLSAHWQQVCGAPVAEASSQSLSDKKSFYWLPYLAIAAGYGLLLHFASKNIEDVLSQLIGIAGILIFLVVFRQKIAMQESDKGKKALEDLQERFQGIYNSSKDAIAFADFDGTFIDVNDSFAQMIGYTREELILKKTFHDLTPPEYGQASGEHVRLVVENSQSIEYEKEYIRKNGTRVPIEVTAFPVKGNDGKPMGLAAIIRDITERKRSEEKLMYNALHDALTGLPNRTLFLEHLRAAINRSTRRRQTKFAVLFLDFDRFKIINDSLGHLEGDKLLILIAQRLKNSLRTGDIVARLGGDEFTVLLDGFEAESDVERIVERIEDALKAPFNLTEREIFISASIGVAINQENYTKPDEMLRDADTAMYYAKAAGKARHQFFTCEMHERANSRLRLENEMRPALERGEFQLYYQPIVELEENRIRGFEALLRWFHPERGIVSPDEFIPIAEETGFIVDLGEWVLRESCWQIKRWQNQNPLYADWSVSVNLSSRQFLQVDLATMIAAILKETKLAPEFLHIEVTESHFMEDSKAAIEIMNCLQAFGVKITIDDFGTGYSSLSYLHHLPIDFLKIDRSFVTEMLEHQKNGEIVRTILTLAQSLGIKVIAEGIETTAQLEHLKNLQCRLGQGYLFSAPLSAQQVERWLNARYFMENHLPGDESLNQLMFAQLTGRDVPQIVSS